MYAISSLRFILLVAAQFCLSNAGSCLREALLRQEAPMYPRPDVQEQPLRHDHGALLFEVQHDGDALARAGWHAMTGARDLDREATQQLEPGM